MIIIATVVFAYYTVWTLFMPFVDENIELHNFFPPRVWAIRIPMMIILFGIAVVGSFLSMVMIKSSQKKRAKLAAQQQGKKKA
ncbi:dolichol phosphate-mannose biosynthesis regulatory [Sphaerosporella brunnea]|uniref:Dolichol phosphate-mannose biosynthesis regulatory protein n=1 Tax=Sphaerosporella brunnea TaxID=1250544 RepID=A0A5J5EMQ9_9PEZI|nr:dolichol phosphate-mannose biosynthesis regulatory [Sphaerosporella brunnea]